MRRSGMPGPHTMRNRNYPPPVKRLLAVLVLAGLLVAAAWATSGQQQVRGRLAKATGGALTDCEIQREGRLGFVTGGGFDSIGTTTDKDGRFSLSMARGLNTLLFRCPGFDVRKRVLVVRGSDSDYELVAAER